MRIRKQTDRALCAALLLVGHSALADITVEGVNVGTSHTIVAGDVHDYGGYAVLVTDPGTLIMTGGDVSSAGSTGTGVFVNGGSFNMTGGQLGGGTSTGSGLYLIDGTATLGGTAYARGGTSSSSTGSAISVNGGNLIINDGTFYGGASTGGAFNIGGGVVDFFGGTFHDSINSPGFGLSIISGGETNIHGGDFLYGFRVSDFGGAPEVNIFNGTFGGELQILGGTTTIYGNAFTVNSTPILAGDLPYAVPDDDAIIQVTYFDSSTETIVTDRLGQGQGTIILTNVPEPASAGLLALGAVGCLRRRRRAERCGL